MANPIPFSKAQRKQIVRRYEKFMSATRIGEAFNVSAAVILRVLREEDIEIRGRGRYPAELTPIS